MVGRPYNSSTITPATAYSPLLFSRHDHHEPRYCFLTCYDLVSATFKTFQYQAFVHCRIASVVGPENAPFNP